MELEPTTVRKVSSAEDAVLVACQGGVLEGRLAGSSLRPCAQSTAPFESVTACVISGQSWSLTALSGRPIAIQALQA